MRHIHPFPARMAPDIALTRIESLGRDKTVLDPMSGSGMVLSQAARSGVSSIGYDLDPLAHLVSRVGATRVSSDLVRKRAFELLDICSKKRKRSAERIVLPWLDHDQESRAFVDYWFYRKQKRQLRALSFHLVARPFTSNRRVTDVLKVALSRLIVSKEPKASLARDTAHSRPHKTITTNEFDVFGAFVDSVEHVIHALDASSIKTDTRAYLGDARRMSRVLENSVDAIITSPPYLNAIDYLRGHRLSLIWLGKGMSKLRTIRSRSIGTERAGTDVHSPEFASLVSAIGLEEIPTRQLRMLSRYFDDLTKQLDESARVLKPGASAAYVVGNSTIRGVYIKNNELLKRAAENVGFAISDEQVRDIPDNRRYLPVTVDNSNSLANRMRTEHVLTLTKPK